MGMAVRRMGSTIIRMERPGAFAADARADADAHAVISKRTHSKLGQRADGLEYLEFRADGCGSIVQRPA